MRGAPDNREGEERRRKNGFTGIKYFEGGTVIVVKLMIISHHFKKSHNSFTECSQLLDVSKGIYIDTMRCSTLTYYRAEERLFYLHVKPPSRALRGARRLDLLKME